MKSNGKNLILYSSITVSNITIITNTVKSFLYMYVCGNRHNFSFRYVLRSGISRLRLCASTKQFFRIFY